MDTNNLISVKAALELVLKSTKVGATEKISINNACGYVLALDVKSPVHSPPFHNSAMDGYAFRFIDFSNGERIKVVGESAAGRSFSGRVNRNEAVRIFTGAEMPKGADTIVMQEKVVIDEKFISINDSNIKRGSNVRLAGSQIKRNQLALKKGHLITPASIGFLASLGISFVTVQSKPLVSLIITGDELVSSGKILANGQIYESNTPVLKSVLEVEGINSIFVTRSKDTYTATLNSFRKAISKSDIVIFTGGISVGDYDFAGHVFKAEKVKQKFHGVKQKPGKPLYFGVKNKKLIFGLPGNPASVLTCFYEFVLPAIRKFQHHPQLKLPVLKLPLANSINKKSGLTVFYKAFTNLETVSISEGQESYIMKSFANSNCFVVLDESTTQAEKGNYVEVHYFG